MPDRIAPKLAAVFYPKSPGVQIDPPKRAITPDQKRAISLAMAGLDITEKEMAEAIVIYLGARRKALSHAHGGLVGYVIDDEVLDLAAGE